MALTKSYSNYVLRKKHQNVNDGTVYERDMTTIGGLNQFSKGQIPIYKDGNFIITVRNDGGISNQYNTNKWEDNGDGTVWTLENVSGLTSNIDDENDLKIVLKQDYYDFNDFAYYGSLSELFRTSINDIVSRFPGELYYWVSGNPIYYTSSYTVDMKVVEESVRLGGNDMYEVSNPFGIDIHNVSKPKEANELKYFADGGFLNYGVICDDDDGELCEIVEWNTKVLNVVVIQKNELDNIYGGDLFYSRYLRNYLDSKGFWNQDKSNEVWWYTCTKNDDGTYDIREYSKNEDGVPGLTDSGITTIIESFNEGDIHTEWQKYWDTRFHVLYNGRDLERSANRPTSLQYNGGTYNVSGRTFNASGGTAPITYVDYDGGPTIVSGWSDDDRDTGVINDKINNFLDSLFEAEYPNIYAQVSANTYIVYREIVSANTFNAYINTVSAETYNSYISTVSAETYNSYIDTVSANTYNAYINRVSADTYNEYIERVSAETYANYIQQVSASTYSSAYTEAYDRLIEEGKTEEEAAYEADIIATNAATEAAESEETKAQARARASVYVRTEAVKSAARAAARDRVNTQEVKDAARDAATEYVNTDRVKRDAASSASTYVNKPEVKAAARASATTYVNTEAVQNAARNTAMEFINRPEEINKAKAAAESKASTEASRITSYDVNRQRSLYTIKEYTPCGSPDCYMVSVSRCKGNKIAIIKIVDCKGREFIIEGWVGDENRVYYLSRDRQNYHIRPNEYFLTEFYNGCDNFEKLLMDGDTVPKYKATFSVIKENDYGYYRELEDFIFPTTYGGYNIDVDSYGFNSYTSRMAQIGEFYDERFTDNMWRSMTHEAIKNFDWTYTREYENGDEEENVIGGQKMQKALRVFAREFDEIISYINNIKSSNRVTYDERGNIPDYFLTDVVENEGWDVKLVYPYTLNEYFNGDESKTPIDSSLYTEIGQLNNSADTEVFDGSIIREFTQNATQEVTPYSKGMIEDGTENGYFIICSDYPIGDVVPSDCLIHNYDNTPHKAIKASGSTISYESVHTKYRIKSYTDERSYTLNAVNNEFLRRLKINSRYIWRHKGTIEGIEMVLGLFGLRSKRFNDRLSDCKSKEMADYEIVEYSSFANYINDPWDAVNQMYRIDWINTTKTITYDNRFISNNNPYGRSGLYSVYEGIPVAYRDVENSYILKGAIGSQEFTNDSGDTEIFMKIDENNALVHERRLYPKFDKNERYDGDPYFQMDGGWLSKKIYRESNVDGEEVRNIYNFQYDLNNNMVYTDYVPKGNTDEMGNITDNEFLYKETIRNIRRTDTLSTLLSIPTGELWNGAICYVSSVESDIMVIEGSVYNVNKKYEKVTVTSEGETTTSTTVTMSIELVKGNGYIRVGNKFFDEAITVYNKDGVVSTVALSDKPDGYSLDAYIKKDSERYDFVCSDYSGSMYSVDNYVYIVEPSEDDTNYFMLNDVNFADSIAQMDSDENWSNGWRRLRSKDKEYFKINTIENYYKGNNPHNGNMVYDNGHEYFTYFKKLFKYPVENYLFDDRCYYNFYNSLDNEIAKYGFSGLIEDNEDILQYDTFLTEDTKIHYFGDYKRKREGSDNVVSHACFYGDGDTESIANKKAKWESMDSGNTSSDYILSDDDLMIGGSPYSAHSTADEVTNQILNNKRMTIRFNLHDAWYTVNGQEEMKFIDDIVMNYLTQVVPSTTILDVVYVSKPKHVESDYIVGQ